MYKFVLANMMRILINTKLIYIKLVRYRNSCVNRSQTFGIDDVVHSVYGTLWASHIFQRVMTFFILLILFYSPSILFNFHCLESFAF